MRLKAKWFSCTLVNAHAPTNEKTEEIFFFLNLELQIYSLLPVEQ